MEQEDLEERLIPAQKAAEAMNVSRKSIHAWFAGEELKGEQTTTGRLWVTAGSCRALIRKRRGGPGSAAEAFFDQYLRRGKLPVSPFSMPEVKPSNMPAMVCS